MSAIVLVIVVFIAFAFVFESTRRKSKQEEDAEPEYSGEALTADDSMPTTTGRFRAQEALGRSTAQELPKAEAPAPKEAAPAPKRPAPKSPYKPTATLAPDGSDPEAKVATDPLPDPFDSNN